MTWRQRFTAPTIHQIAWAEQAPDRLGVVSSESGSLQAWWWDLTTGERGVASNGGAGAEEVHVLPDGSGVVWWFDPSGDERGRWMTTPFGGEPKPLFPMLGDGWMMGISLGKHRSAVGLADDNGYSVFVVEGEDAIEIHRSESAAGVGREWPQGAGGLSEDGGLVCIRHTETGDMVHSALRVLELPGGRVVGELADPGCAVVPVAWKGRRLALSREISGFERPWVWDFDTGTLSEWATDLPGAVRPLGWAGDELILLSDHEAVHRVVLAGEVLREGGTVESAAARPDGAVWMLVHDSEHPPSVVDGTGTVVLSLPASPPPPGRHSESFWFTNPSGARIQGWLMLPDCTGPHRAIVSVHGGPEYHDTDGYHPRRLAYADAGWAVVTVNYRGSTGFGRAHRDVLRGNVGFPESEDIVAAVDHLVAAGIVDAGRVVLEGWSWGGYLATLNAGIHPDRWRAVIAGIPVGDSVAAHYECAPAIRQWEVEIMGGDPLQLPDLYHERNPMTYVEAVTAPMLMIAGEHDSRCPLGQVMVYAHALRRRNHDVTVHLYQGGHHATDVSDQVAITELILDFLATRDANR